MFKKKYGQNFLQNNEICKKIISFENIKDNNILEIGPGNLALTKLILNKKPKNFVAIEIDTDLIKKNIELQKEKVLINFDALKFNELEYFKKEKFSIISNLPFNISSELLIKWIKLQCNYRCIKSMTLMFQKELAERIIAKINTKKYGRITLLTNAFFMVKKKLLVDKNNFFPKPKIDAIVLKFLPLIENKVHKEKITNLEKISYIFFNERRKINEKKIKKVFTPQQIKKYNFNNLFKSRAENINMETYYKMANLL